jgi:hypothetical protein
MENLDAIIPVAWRDFNPIPVRTISRALNVGWSSVYPGFGPIFPGYGDRYGIQTEN